MFEARLIERAMKLSGPVQKETGVTPGTEIAGFRVLKDLGTGAASNLFLVQDPKTKQIWTLKQVHKETEKDQRYLDQTETEYAVGSQLSHPNLRHVERLIKNRRVIRVNEIILIMEFADGLTLDEHPPQTFEVAALIFQQVADGLLYMHRHGFVHADMKPNNLIVTDTGHVKIIDLGQSCRIGTIKERIQGTVDYIAPEQVLRKAIMPETDVYNLGASMYWALTRKHIPTAMTDKSSLGITKDPQFLEMPKPPVEIDGRVPLDFSGLAMECIRPDPKDRLSMEEVRNKLQIIQVKIESAARGQNSARASSADT